MPSKRPVRGRPPSNAKKQKKATTSTAHVENGGNSNTEDSEHSGSPTFTGTQLAEIQALISSSVKDAVEAAASSAAKAAVDVMRAEKETAAGEKGETTTPADDQIDLVSDNREDGRNTGSMANIIGELNQTIKKLQQSQSQARNPTQDIPPQYIRDIQSGEFFYLAKLLPKNLTPSHFMGAQPEEPITLTLDNSTIKVSRNSTIPISEIEDWTTAFTSYMSVFIQKFPSRAPEFLEYMKLIRYASQFHKGVGWAIYDHKFRQKLSQDKTLNWAIIDSHLWLQIFTVPPSSLREQYSSFFPNGPHKSTSAKGIERTCYNYNKAGVVCNRDPCPFIHQCNKPNCNGEHPGYKCPLEKQARKSSRSNHQ